MNMMNTEFVYNHQIRTGDLLVWSYDSSRGWGRFVKKFIQMMTLSDYSHVGVALVLEERVLVLEATEPKIAIRPLINKTNMYVVPMNMKNTEGLHDIMKEFVGLRYSIYDCIRAYVGRYTKDNDSWQCAELATEIYERMGMDIKPERLTPKGVVRAALQHAKTGIWLY